LYGAIDAGYVLQNFWWHFFYGAYFTKVLQMNIVCAKQSISCMHWSCSLCETHAWANVSCSSTDKKRKDLAELPWLSELIFICIQGQD
jgi:hypothetical protein